VGRSLPILASFVVTSFAACLPAVYEPKWDEDGDGDPNVLDCDPDDAGISHEAAEDCDDEIDNDCDGAVDGDDLDCVDPDGDGHYGAEADCDETDPEVYFGHEEWCDGKDNDCVDGVPADEVDDDGDGQMVCAGDCDDADPAVGAFFPEVCDDGVDNDCDATDSPCVAFGSTVELENADAVWTGELTGDELGDSIAAVPPSSQDVDGCVLMGAEKQGTTSAGAAYLVCGAVAGERSAVDVETVWYGTTMSERVGNAVTAAGDVDADGRTDLMVGAPSHENIQMAEPGRVYLLLGTEPTSQSVLEQAAVIYEAEAILDDVGPALASAGDVDGGGHADLLIGAEGNDRGGTEAGAAYLVMGEVFGEEPPSGIQPLADADVVFVGEATQHRAGSAVAGAGDVDGDGYDDVLIGAPQAEGVGAAYLWHGAQTWPQQVVDCADADMTFHGGEFGDHAGIAVAGAGDVYGDTFDDVLIGASGVDGAAGAVYVLDGPMSESMGPEDAACVLTGEVPGDEAGSALAGRGDVDGDGVPDLLIGAPRAIYTGMAYLVLGNQLRGEGGDGIDLHDARTGLRGVAPDDEAGSALAFVGDLQGNGADEILIGAKGSEDLAGAVYLLYGWFED